MKRTAKRIVLACLVMILTLCALTASAQYQKPYILNAFDNTPLDLSPYRGKALFLHFFTESSPYCEEEMAKIKNIYDTYSQDDLQIILIHVWDDEDETSTQRVMEKYGLEELTFYEDRSGEVAKAISVPACPFSFFIDKLGYLEDAIVHSQPYDVLVEIIEWMEVGKATAVAETPAPTAQETPAPEADGTVVQIVGSTMTSNSTATPSPQPTATSSPKTTATPSPQPTAIPTAESSGGAPLGSKGIVVN